MNRSVGNRLATLAFMAVAVVSSPLAGAQELAGHSGVRDRAGLFSPEALKKANAALESVRAQTRWGVVVDTVESLDGREIKEVTLENARKLKEHGLYVLISKKEHNLYMEPSNSARKVFNQETDAAIRTAFTDAFKARDFDKGLADAVALIRKDAGASPDTKAAAAPPLPPPIENHAARRAEAPAAVPAPAEAPEQKPSGGGVMGLLILGLIALGVLWAVSKMFRRPAVYQQGAPGMGGYGPRPGGPPPGYGQPGYGPAPGYGQPGYGPAPAQGGGGFLSGALGGLGGAVAGNILYDKFGRPHTGEGNTEGSVIPTHGGGDSAWPPAEPAGASTESYDPNAGTGGDWGGGDTGATGGDWGGGDTGNSGGTGGDWGGGDTGGDAGTGGDWGGGAGDNQGDNW